MGTSWGEDGPEVARTPRGSGPGTGRPRSASDSSRGGPDRPKGVPRWRPSPDAAGDHVLLGRRSSMLARLKVRTKLIAILLPLLLGLGVLASLGVLDRLQERALAEKTVELIEGARANAALVHQLQLERLLMVALQNGDAEAGQNVDAVKDATDEAAARLRAQVQDIADLDTTIGNQSAEQVATQLDQQLDAIDAARSVYNPSSGSPQVVSDAYTAIIDVLNGSGTQMMQAGDRLGGG